MSLLTLLKHSHERDLSLFSIVLLTLASTATSQIPLPACAQPCYNAGISGAYGCLATDYGCFCVAPAVNEYFDCVKKDCSNPADVQQFIEFGNQNCGLIGITPFASSSVPEATSSAGVVATIPASTNVASATATAISNIAAGSATAVASGFVTVAGAQQPTVTVTPSTPSQSLSPAPSPAPQSSSGLSDSAKIGIAVGATIAGILILGLLGFCIYLIRKRSNVGAAPAGQSVVGAMDGNMNDSEVGKYSTTNSGSGTEWTKHDMTAVAEGIKTNEVAEIGDQDAEEQLRRKDAELLS